MSLRADLQPKNSRRATNPLKVVAIAGVSGSLVLVFALVAVAMVADRVTPIGETTLHLEPKVAVLSARRAPTTLSILTRTSRVRRALADVSSKIPTNGCLSVEWLGQSMSDIRSDQMFTPASAVKVITAAAALEVLGPNFTYETNVYGALDASGTVGDLYIVGGGDPLIVRSEYLATEKYPTTTPTTLESIADAIVAAGVRSIAGSVVGVDSRYDSKRFIDKWPTSFNMVEAGPLGALMANDGAVIGQPFKSDNPAWAAATELTSLLAARGVVASTLPRHDVLVSGVAKITTIKSAPLSDIVKEMLTSSDNNTAELLLKEIGLAKTGIGSTQAGLDATTSLLSSWGLAATVSIHDGSGLAMDNKASCKAFLAILKTNTDLFIPTMAVAGKTGTLRDVFTKESVNGRLIAKTGTLTGVKSLVGYLPIVDSEPVRFSLLMNRAGIDNQSAYRSIWYSLSQAMDKARSTPSVDQLMP